VLGLFAALIVVAVVVGALGGMLATRRTLERQLGRGYLGDRIVSWIDTSSALVESVAGVEPPLRLEVDSGVRRRLPLEDVLMHLGGAGWAVGADKNGALLAVDLSRGAARDVAASKVAVARCGAKSPDARLVAARELDDGAPTDAWSVFSADGTRVAKLTVDGAGSAGGDPAWAPDSEAVALPLEPGDADEATIVVAWAPGWRALQIKVKGYEGGSVAFDPGGGGIVFAKPGSDGELRRAGRATGEIDAAARVPGLGGLAGRAADGRLAVFVTRADPKDLGGEPGPETGAVLLFDDLPDGLFGGGPDGIIRLPCAVESAVLDPAGERALVVCARSETARELYVVDLASARVRPVPVGSGAPEDDAGRALPGTNDGGT
jgi:hypothetical protein